MVFKKISNDEDGFVLVTAMMVMVILTLIGIAGLNTSMFEEQIAGNEWNAKRSFYKADGGLSVGYELVEQNFSCPTGFGSVGVLEDTLIKVNNTTFSGNPIYDTDSMKVKLDDPSNNYDAAYPSDSFDANPDLDVGYLYFSGSTMVLPGGALEMAAGYEGKGKAAAQGGIAKLVDIYSQFLGPRSSEAIIVAGWRHLVGTEGSCNY